MQNLNRGETFQLQPWIQTAQCMKQVGVIAERQGWMESADDVQFGDPKVKRFAGFLNNFINRKLETIRVALFTGKGAELAAENAIIRIIDIAINDIASPVADPALASEISDGTKCIQIFGFEKPQSIDIRNPFARD